MIDGTEAAAAVPWKASTFSVVDQIHVSLLWFALFANWLTVVPVILPDQVATILGVRGVAGQVEVDGLDRAGRVLVGRDNINTTGPVAHAWQVRFAIVFR